jgi:hypothetical protein
VSINISLEGRDTQMRGELTIQELNLVSGGQVVYASQVGGITQGRSDDGSSFVRWTGADGTTYVVNSKSGYHQFGPA